MEGEEREFVKCCLQILKPLNSILRLLSLTPYKDADEAITTLSKRNRIYDKIQMFVTVLVVFLSFIGKFIYNYSKYSTHVTTIILDLANTTLQTILIVVSIRSNIYEDTKDALLFFSKISTVCTNVYFTRKEYKNSQVKMFIECVVIIFATIGIATLDIWISINLYEFTFVFCNCYQYWLFFYEFIVFMQIEVKIELIKQMYSHMNQLLMDNSVEFNSKVDECINIRDYLGHFKKNKFNVYEIAKTHYMIGEIITLINKTHGIQILAIVCSLILAMLTLLNEAIIVVQSKNEEKSTFTYISVVVQLLWCLCLLIIGIVISSLCSSTLRYANDTKVISQKLLLQDRPLLKGNDNDNKIFKYQLQLLYSSGNIPVFSAAGFFAVDFTVIYEVMGAVTTYFIVLLQFAGVTS